MTKATQAEGTVSKLRQRNIALTAENRALKAALEEFVQDIASVPRDHVKEDWPDLLITYDKARAALGLAEEE